MANLSWSQVPRATSQQQITDRLSLAAISDPASPAAGDLWRSSTTADTLKYRSGGTTYSLLTLGGALGTPSSATLTNATGLPIATGVSGLGTGIATALAINTGSAGAPVLFNGAGGAPSSLTLTNATGLPLTTGVTGTLPVANGGTGATSLTSTALLLGAGTSAITPADLTYSSPTLTVPDGFTVSSAGSIALTAGGSNKNITLTPSAGGIVSVAGATGNFVRFTRASTGPSTNYLALYNNDTTDGNGALINFTTDTTGTGASAFQALARFGGIFTTHDHATRTGQINFYVTARGAESNIFNITSTGIQLPSASPSSLAWGTTGPGFSASTRTYTDSSSSGTVATAVANSFAVPTFAASSATTFTNAANLYIAGDVAAGTNTTLTNSYGLWNAGKTRLDDRVLINAAAPTLTISSSSGTDSPRTIFQIAGASSGLFGIAGATNSLVSGSAAADMVLRPASGSAVRFTTDAGTTSALVVAGTGAVQLPSTNTAGIQLYNTSDQTANWQRLEARFDGSNTIAQLGTRTNGTISAVPLNLFGQTSNGAGAYGRLDIASGFPFLRQGLYTTTTGTTLQSSSGTGAAISMGNGTFTATSGTISILTITPTYNQASGTAANTDLLINRTETAVGSGAQRLIDAQVGSSSKFSVTNTGIATAIGGVTVSSTGTNVDGIWSSTATLDFGSIAAAAYEDLTITVTGASTGDIVDLGRPSSPTAGIIFQGFVSASNTVTVRATNITASPVDPSSATYRATVISH